jgi:hypothetical protein
MLDFLAVLRTDDVLSGFIVAGLEVVSFFFFGIQIGPCHHEVGILFVTMCHAHCFILFLSTCSIAIFLGQLPKAISVSTPKGFVPTFISSDVVKHSTFQHSHTAFKSYQGAIVERIFDGDDDGFGMRDDASINMASEKQHSLGTREISPYYKQDRREFDARGSPIFPPVRDHIGLANLLKQRHIALLSDNFIAGNNEMYEQVALIDQRLKNEHNVVVYSHPPIWSRFDFNAPPDAIRKQQIQKEMHTLQRAFGPTGHPYQHVGASEPDYSYLDCDLSMTEIHNLLSQYTKYKCTFQPELTDATLFELKLHGVRLSDRTFRWTTDPLYDIDSMPEETNVLEMDNDFTVNSSFTTDLFNRIRRNRNQTVVERQTYSQYPMVMDRIDPFIVEGKSLVSKSHQRIQQVEQLIRDRVMALHREEHDLVAWITFELYCTFNVTVNDTSKVWSFNGATMDPTIAIPRLPLAFPNPKARLIPSLIFGNEGHFYNSAIRYRESRRSRSPPDLPEPQRGRIAALVQERIQKRDEGKFQEADTIRTILWHTYVSFCHSFKGFDVPVSSGPFLHSVGPTRMLELTIDCRNIALVACLATATRNLFTPLNSRKIYDCRLLFALTD